MVTCRQPLKTEANEQPISGRTSTKKAIGASSWNSTKDVIENGQLRQLMS